MGKSRWYREVDWFNVFLILATGGTLIYLFISLGQGA